MSTGSPLELRPTEGTVVRLNRRVIYVVGAVLIAAFLAGLIAIRAQGARLRDSDAQHRAALAPRAHPWFEAVPDQDATAHPVKLDALPPTPPAQATPKAPTADELEAQRRQRVLHTAMAAPIAVAAFERSGGDRAGRRRGDHQTDGATPVGLNVPADQAQDERTLKPVAAPTTGGATRGDGSWRDLPPEYLRASVRTSVSPYEVKAGTIIPAVMLSAINSDLPGQILGQVRENVYDSDTGEHLLIPQGTRLVGLYDHRIVYAQQRVLITWKRLLLPNGSSLSLKEGMPGTDAVGAAGFNDQVNNHYARIFGTALLLSVISAGVQLSQIPDFGQGFRGPTAGNVLGAAVGQQLGSAAAESLRRGMTVAPTLEIRPGYPFNVMVTQDIVFPGPYEEVTSR